MLSNVKYVATHIFRRGRLPAKCAWEGAMSEGGTLSACTVYTTAMLMRDIFEGRIDTLVRLHWTRMAFI